MSQKLLSNEKLFQWIDAHKFPEEIFMNNIGYDSVTNNTYSNIVRNRNKTIVGARTKPAIDFLTKYKDILDGETRRSYLTENIILKVLEDADLKYRLSEWGQFLPTFKNKINEIIPVNFINSFENPIFSELNFVKSKLEKYYSWEVLLSNLKKLRSDQFIKEFDNPRNWLETAKEREEKIKKIDEANLFDDAAEPQEELPEELIPDWLKDNVNQPKIDIDQVLKFDINKFDATELPDPKTRGIDSEIVITGKTKPNKDFIQKINYVFKDDLNKVYIEFKQSFGVTYIDILEPTNMVRAADDEAPYVGYNTITIQPMIFNKNEHLPLKSFIRERNYSKWKFNNFPSKAIQDNDGKPIDGPRIAVDKNTYFYKTFEKFYEKFNVSPKPSISVYVTIAFSKIRPDENEVENGVWFNSINSIPREDNTKKVVYYSSKIFLDDIFFNYRKPEEVIDQINSKILKNSNEDYKAFYTIFKVIKVMFEVKVFSSSIVAGSVNNKISVVHPKYLSKIYSPDKPYCCFIECLKKIGIADDSSISKIVKLNNKKIDLQSTNTKILNMIMKIIDPEMKYCLYVYKPNKDTGKYTERPVFVNRFDEKYNRREISDNQIRYNLLIYLNHIMWFNEPVLSKEFQDLCVDDLFSVGSEEPVVSCDMQGNTNGKWTDLSGSLSTKHLGMTNKVMEQHSKKAKYGRLKFPKTVIWDTETLPDRDGKFYVYQISVLELDDTDYNCAGCSFTELIEKPEYKPKFKSFYGYDCVSKFYNYMYEMSEDLIRKYRVKASEIITHELYKDYGKRKKTDLLDSSGCPNSRDFINELAIEMIKAEDAQIYYIAHNASRFDNILIMSDPKIRSKINRVINSSGILEMELFGCLIFKDFYRFLDAGLDRICKDLKISDKWAKTTFPYEFMRIDSTMGEPDFRQKFEEKIYHIGECKYGDSEDFCKKMGIDVFDVKDYTEKYALNDVMSLGIAFYITSKAYYDISQGYNLWEFFTSANFSNAYVCERINKEHLEYEATIKKHYCGKCKNEIVNILDNTMGKGITKKYYCKNCKDYYLEKILIEKKEKHTFDWENRQEAFDILEKNKATKPVYFVNFSDYVDDHTTAVSITVHKAKPIERIKKDHENMVANTLTSYLVDNYIRKAIRGGRVFPCKLNFVSKNANGVATNDFSTEDYLLPVDATSLYPSAMASYKYPVGKPIWVPENELNNSIESILKNYINYDTHAIIDCDIIYSKTEKIAFPLIAFKHPDGRTTYDSIDKRITISNIDLLEAMKYNFVTIGKVYSILFWQNSDYIYKDEMTTLFNKRLEAKRAKQKSLDTGYKTIMNSSYGYTIKKVIYDKVKYVYNNTDFEKILLTKKVVNYEYTHQEEPEYGINFENMRIDYKEEQDKVDIKSPSHLGVFILARSKQLMNTFINEFNGFGLGCSEEERWERCPYYTDTDSVYIHKKYYDEVKDKTNPWGLKWCPGYKSNGTVAEGALTQFHDDADETLFCPKVTKAFFLMPKVKYIKYVGKIPEDDKTNPGKIVVRDSATLKGVTMKAKAGYKKAKILSIEKRDGSATKPHENIDTHDFFEAMAEGYVIKTETSKFAKQYKRGIDAFVQNTSVIKETNRNKWAGKIYDEKTNRFEIISQLIRLKIDNNTAQYGHNRVNS